VDAERAGCVVDGRRRRECHGHEAAGGMLRATPPRTGARRRRTRTRVATPSTRARTRPRTFAPRSTRSRLPRAPRLRERAQGGPSAPRGRRRAHARRGRPGVAEDMPEVVGAQDPELSRDRLSLEAWATMWRQRRGGGSRARSCGIYRSRPRSPCAGRRLRLVHGRRHTSTALPVDRGFGLAVCPFTRLEDAGYAFTLQGLQSSDAARPERKIRSV
jgi:hypothetical protein